jgi:hypothetical protein
MKREGGRIAFRLNTGEFVVAGPAHALRLESRPGGARPYLHVRAGLDALVARPVFYELAELALTADPPGVWSDGAFFPFADPA